MRAVAAVAAGEADALVSGGSTGAALAASLFTLQARARRAPAGAGDHGPGPGRAVPAARRGRERRGPARAPRPVRAHGRGVHGGRRRGRVAARRAAGQRRRRRPRAPRSSSPRIACWPAAPGLNFVGNVEGFAIGTGRGGRDRRRRLHRQRGAEGDGGRPPRRCSGAVRGAAMSSLRSKLGGLLLRPALRGLRDELSPEEQGGAVLLGLRQARRRAARLVRRARLPARDRGRGARRARGRRRPHARAARWRPERCGRASEAVASVPEES